MTFEANNGQTDPRVKFLSRAPGYTLFLTDKEAVLSLAADSPVVGRLRIRGNIPEALQSQVLQNRKLPSRSALCG